MFRLLLIYLIFSGKYSHQGEAGYFLREYPVPVCRSPYFFGPCDLP
jgi:hypothetical protein